MSDALSSLVNFRMPFYGVDASRFKLGRHVFEALEDDGHVWLRIGTDNTDDYYPSFVFFYQPRTR